MDTGQNYAVKDLSLAEQGLKNIEFAEREMGALLKVRERFAKEKPLKGLRVGMALHLTKETAVLVKTLIAGGADVAICSCNPLSTQDDVAAALAKSGIKVFGYKGESKEDYYKFINAVIATNPNITIDDGCDLVTEIHTKHPQLMPQIIGGCEETSTGVIRLKAMEKDGALKYPVVAVNDNKTKHLLDNYVGTGQSAIDGLIRATNTLLAGKNVVVCGYGDCGKGVALRAKGHGSNIIVTEVNPFRAVQAVYDGHRVMPIAEAAAAGDIFITVTGNKHVLGKEHFEKMKDGAILANAGHFDIELDLVALKKMSKEAKQIRLFLEEYKLGNKSIFVAASGRLVNLSAAEGHPSAVMATSFCGQALAVEYLVKNKGKLPAAVITLPEGIDDNIARLQLEAMGVKIDSMTNEQKKYVESWQEGT
ncbi:adenosylhomocysteinase [Candidatus Woesearchaeota archaeon]|nr:adenosylhomocysteinase [Candidatus Woesearchaeota archaeon]MBI2550166.1 adenosylhomocysteinase [Candidatus Woesearchaeota archaeon]